MCQSKAEGGLRCFPHANQRLINAVASADPKRIAEATHDVQLTKQGIASLRAEGKDFEADVRQAERDALKATESKAKQYRALHSNPDVVEKAIESAIEFGVNGYPPVETHGFNLDYNYAFANGKLEVTLEYTPKELDTHSDEVLSVIKDMGLEHSNLGLGSNVYEVADRTNLAIQENIVEGQWSEISSERSEVQRAILYSISGDTRIGFSEAQSLVKFKEVKTPYSGVSYREVESAHRSLF